MSLTANTPLEPARRKLFMNSTYMMCWKQESNGNLQIFFLSPLPSTYHSSVISPSLNAKPGQRHVKLPRINEVGQGSISSAHKPFKRNLFTTNPNLIMSWQTSKSYMSYLHIEQYFHHWISNIRSTASWTQIPKRELPSQLWRPREL